MSNTQKIIDNTSYQDLASMSFGFPTEDEILDQAFNSFGGDGGSNDSRTSVNGEVSLINLPKHLLTQNMLMKRKRLKTSGIDLEVNGKNLFKM